MKLRNKKTGKIIDIDIIENRKDGSWEWQAGKTLHDLNREWEDYKPKDPLIKDEKIRKAVREWAEALGLEHIIYWHKNYDDFFAFMDEKTRLEIMFQGEVAMLKDGVNYTITELCGEEE